MNGFSWVRVDRATDRSAPVRLLARAMGKDELWALGCYVRLRLVTAGRFPTGLIDMPASHLELELDAPDGTVSALVSCGLLVARPDGFEVPGWQDDPAVREVLNKRVRASGRPADGYLSQGVGQAVAGGTAGLSQGVPQPVAGGTAATPQPVAALSQPVAGGSATYMTDMTDTTDTQDMPPMRERGGDTPPPPANPSRSEAPLPLAYTEAAGLVLAAWPPEKRCAPRGVVMAIRQDSGHPDGHTCRKIAEAARVWVAAYEAQGRVQYLPRLDNWISSGAWREAPPADAPAAAGPARRPRTKSGDPAVTAAELGAIIEHAKAAGL